MLAGPFCGAILAWFGAEVIKVEPPKGGDPLRTWRHIEDGTSLWWYILGRNKKSITADLRQESGRDLVRRLIARSDVVIENFRPGRMEEWGLGPDDIAKLNPRTILARVSGYGQTGPYARKPGYASVAEGYGGLRYLTGFPDRPPARANLSLGDSIAGLHAALGILTAVYHRDVNGGAGQVVDVAIVEGIFNLMESMVPEFTSAGIVRERHGSKVSGIVPSSTYPCADGKYIIIGGNGDSIFKRLMRVVGRADLAEDPRVARNDGRVTHEAEIDEAIEGWTRQRPFADVLQALEDAGVPAGPIYSVADQVARSALPGTRPVRGRDGVDGEDRDAAGAGAAARRHARAARPGQGRRSAPTTTRSIAACSASTRPRSRPCGRAARSSWAQP